MQLSKVWRGSATARRFGWSCLGLVVAAYVALSMHLPMELHPDFGADDGWFYVHASYLVSGHWFGPYSETTLMKGPGYVFFLAINYLLGLPITLSHALLQIGACGLFAWGIRRISGCSLLATAVFLLSLWHPYLFSSRVIRDAIYAPQTLLFLGCLLQLLAPQERGRRMAWSIATGLSFTWFWLTREEGVWILPSVGLLCVAAVWRDKSRLFPLARAGVTVLLAFAALAACDFAAYRTWAIVDFKGGAYNRAVNALQRVRVGPPVAYVPVPAKVRARIYDVSPTFAALRPYLEGPTGRGWMTPGCQVYPTTCGDYAGGWFIWALRGGAGSLGAYRTPADADRFYAKLTSEVTSACRSGRLTCGRTIVDFLPQITSAQWRTAPAKLHELSNFILARLPDTRWNSTGNVAIDAMQDFVGYPRRDPSISETLFTVSGWYRGQPSAWVQVRCGGTVIPIERRASPDIVQYFQDPKAADDRFVARIIGNNCGIQAQGSGLGDPTTSLDVTPSNTSLAGGQLFIDSRGDDKPDRVRAAHAMKGLIKAYKILMPCLLAAALVAYLVHLVQWARGSAQIDTYWWTVQALWLMVLVRCVILLLVDISSFPGLTVAYLAPIFPLLASAALMSLALPLRRTPPARAT